MTASGIGAEPPIPTRSWAVLAVCSSVAFLTLLDSGGVFVEFPSTEEQFADQT